jgi:hypothetical protein
LGHRGSLVF